MILGEALDVGCCVTGRGVSIGETTNGGIISSTGETTTGSNVSRVGLYYKPVVNEYKEEVKAKIIQIYNVPR